MIDTLIVCGDSFFTPAKIKYLDAQPIDYTGTHWSEIVSKELNLNLLNLAMRGCSNRAIIYQLLQSHRTPNSIVIAGCAASQSRVEFTYTPDQFHRDIDRFSYIDSQGDHPLGTPSELAHVYSKPVHMIDDHEVRNLFMKYFPIGHYADIDKLIILASLRKLKVKNIPFLFVENIFGPPFLELRDYLDFIDESDLILEKDINFFENVYNTNDLTEEEILRLDPGYHTHPDEQKRIAEYVCNRLKPMLGI